MAKLEAEEKKGSDEGGGTSSQESKSDEDSESESESENESDEETEYEETSESESESDSSDWHEKSESESADKYESDSESDSEQKYESESESESEEESESAEEYEWESSEYTYESGDDNWSAVLTEAGKIDTRSQMRMAHVAGLRKSEENESDASFETVEMNGESGDEDYVEGTFESLVSIRSKNWNIKWITIESCLQAKML